MRKLILFIILQTLFHLAKAIPNSSNTSFIFEGEIKGYGDGEIIMAYSNPNEKMKPDTIVVKNDKFVFSGKLEAPLWVFTKIMNNGKLDRDYFRFDFMLENSVIKFNADVKKLNEFTLTGSTSYDSMIKIRSGGRKLVEEYLKIERVYNKQGEEESEQKEQLKKEMEKQMDAYLNYLFSYKGVYKSYAAVFLLQLFPAKRISWQRLDTILTHFDKSVRNSTYFTYMQRIVNAAKQIQIGKNAASFVVKDLNGKNYSLNSFRGHYLLMTFSASWCGPCKLEYPFLIKANEEYADKGLKVIIINLDDSRDKWAGEVVKYKFPFPVLSDLKAFTGSLTKNYGVMSIPKIFLISPTGEIVSNKIRQQKILDELSLIYSKVKN